MDAVWKRMRPHRVVKFKIQGIIIIIEYVLSLEAGIVCGRDLELKCVMVRPLLRALSAQKLLPAEWLFKMMQTLQYHTRRHSIASD